MGGGGFSERASGDIEAISQSEDEPALESWGRDFQVEVNSTCKGPERPFVERTHGRRPVKFRQTLGQAGLDLCIQLWSSHPILVPLSPWLFLAPAT